MSSTIAPEDLTIEILEHVFGEPPKSWHGRCSELAHAATQLVGGKYAYGHYLGSVNPRGFWGRYIGCPFLRHAWVILDDGRILDPTRWSFLSLPPRIWLAENDGSYDEGGQQWREALRSPPPKDNPGMDHIVLDISAEAAAHINGMLMRKDHGKISFEQACWLASGPLSSLGDFAYEFFELLIENDWEATIPVDHKRMVMG